MKIKLPAFASIGLAIALALPTASRAQTDIEQFYKKTPLRIVAAFGPGSGYTAWARFIAEYIGKYIPGHPSIIVQNMGGAGGLLATNYAYDIAPKDGSEIFSVPREVPVFSALKAKGVHFDATHFHWLGSPTSDTDICVTSKAAPWRSINDAYSKTLLVGSDGAGSGMHTFPVALNSILGMKFKVIDGYTDASVILLAMDNGEIQGLCQSAETLLRTRSAQIASGAMKIVLQAGLRPDPRLHDVPFVLDLAKSAKERQSLKFLYASLSFGRPYLAPPGTPPERVAVLRKAFSDLFKDPDFLSDAKKQKYDINSMTGAEMQKLVGDVAATPPDIVTQIGAIIEPAGTR